MRSGRIRHGLFFIHLALEKILKANFCRNKMDIPPRNHNLARLAEISGVDLSDERTDVLADVNAYNLEGRYPDIHSSEPSKGEAEQIVKRADEVFQWLRSQL